MRTAWSRRPIADRRSQLASSALVSEPVIPRGSGERRRPVTGNAACDRSVLTSPSMTQNRRNDRNPATKYCVALTDTTADSRSTAATTSPAVTSPRSTGPRPSRNRPACVMYPRTVPAAKPRSARKNCSNRANRSRRGEPAGVGSTAATPKPRSTSSMHSKPGRDHWDRNRPVPRWKSRNSSTRAPFSSAAVSPFSSSQLLSRATWRDSLTTVRRV
jgi:hypothetical protein